VSQHATCAALLTRAVWRLVTEQGACAALEGPANAIRAVVHPAATLTSVCTVVRGVPVHIAALAEGSAAVVRCMASVTTLQCAAAQTDKQVITIESSTRQWGRKHVGLAAAACGITAGMKHSNTWHSSMCLVPLFFHAETC
jgi:hypothetical protein